MSWSGSVDERRPGACLDVVQSAGKAAPSVVTKCFRCMRTVCSELASMAPQESAAT